jgi:SAM-dependent methyltransferase
MEERAFPPGAFRRLDEEDDRLFYGVPRRVVHLDEAALAALTRLYGVVVPPTGSVLDLMASWRSHLPPWFKGTVVGLGLNREEMRDNPQLSQALVHDLNREPRLPLNDGAFDAALCAVSVQYLTQPVEVFREVARTLRPGAPFVTAYFHRSGLWEGLTEFAHTPATGDPLYAVWGLKKG